MTNNTFALKFVDKIYKTLAEYQAALETYERKLALYPQGRNAAQEIAVTARIDMLLEMFYWMQSELRNVELPVSEYDATLDGLVDVTPEEFAQTLKKYFEDHDEKEFISPTAS